jgi:hypothetical protein
LKRFLVLTIGDVEPEIHGPYDNEGIRNEAAKDFRREDPEKDNGIFPLDIEDDGTPHIDSYSNGFFEEEKEEEA